MKSSLIRVLGFRERERERERESMATERAERPHVVCVPFPSQGHVTPMMVLAKLLHTRGFYITFVNTEFNHNRFLRSRGPDSLQGIHGFRFEAIPDGLPWSDRDATQDPPTLCKSTSENCLVPFRHLLNKLNNTPNIPPVTSILSDGMMSFTSDVAQELGIPDIFFLTCSACGFLGYLHYHHFLERDLIPFKDENFSTDGSLDAPMSWIPGMNEVRLRDMPSFVRTMDPNDIMLNFFIRESERASKATAVIMNTFEDLERKALDAIRDIIIPPLYTIGPLSLLSTQLPDGDPLNSLVSNLWKEDKKCVGWLDTKGPRSVVYVNFGSITVMTPKQLEEFAWGLANSSHPFLWILRPDAVGGDSVVLPPGFATATKERGLIANWCPQEQVLAHPSTGVFLTHCGWNSILEAICGGVPVMCWPFFGEQPTNCRYACTEWGIGMEINNDVDRDEVVGIVREMMEGDKGKEMSKKAMEWKELAEISAKQGGSSYENLNNSVLQLIGAATQ